MIWVSFGRWSGMGGTFLSWESNLLSDWKWTPLVKVEKRYDSWLGYWGADLGMCWKYLKNLLRHKWFVFQAACELGIPWLGLVHDLSKFRPSEFIAYAAFFCGAAQADPDILYASRVAWNHHQKRNKHHWQYWMLTNDTEEPQTMLLPMPEKYCLEMLADWIGAGRAYGNPDTLHWYKGHRDKIKVHIDTREWIESKLW